MHVGRLGNFSEDSRNRFLQWFSSMTVYIDQGVLKDRASNASTPPSIPKLLCACVVSIRAQLNGMTLNLLSGSAARARTPVGSAGWVTKCQPPSRVQADMIWIEMRINACETYSTSLSSPAPLRLLQTRGQQT